MPKPAMKSVCIVGAGPSGLVGAKVLLQTGKFKVTIFEKSDRIGGIWALDQQSKNAFLHPDTPTNLSRFTVSFSDLDWNLVNLRSVSEGRSTDGALSQNKAPVFPKAWQVNRYLESYRQKNVPDEFLKLSHEVVKTRRSAHNGVFRWYVSVRSKEGAESELEFDHLMLGSGFFSDPRPMSRDLIPCAQDLRVKAIHSSRFRTLSDLFSNPEIAQGKKILLIGGGNSAGEAAAAVAQQLSNARYAPVTGRQNLYKDCKILHVTPRPFYALPPYVATDESSISYTPIDLKLYDLQRRPEGPIVGSAGRVPKGVKDMIHGAIQGLVGGDQSDLGTPALRIPPGEPRPAVYVALSESYPEFVRSGLIEVMSGRVKELKPAKDAKGATAELLGPSGTIVVENDIGAIIYATGYTPASAIRFLPDNVKDTLRYDADSLRLPLMLSGWQTTTPALPDLALLGFYEGPYWPMIEMQARYTAHRWLADDPAPETRPYEEMEKLLDLRETIKARGEDVPQYWFGDYLGYMEEMASWLKLQRNDAPFTSAREGCASPARYLDLADDKSQAGSTMAELYRHWKACAEDGRYAARAAFRALQGNWRISRNIDSKLASFPSGRLIGTASFHPRQVTSDKSGLHFDLEYLYIESGQLRLSNGAEMPARRRYVYRYSEARDELSVWFVKPEDDLQVDYLFHNVEFAKLEESKKAGALISKADHLCVKDMYYTEYRLPLKGISLHSFETKHTVRGPEKDYVAITEYTRPVLQNTK